MHDGERTAAPARRVAGRAACSPPPESRGSSAQPGAAACVGFPAVAEAVLYRLTHTHSHYASSQACFGCRVAGRSQTPCPACVRGGLRLAARAAEGFVSSSTRGARARACRRRRTPRTGREGGGRGGYGAVRERRAARRARRGQAHGGPHHPQPAAHERGRRVRAQPPRCATLPQRSERRGAQGENPTAAAASSGGGRQAGGLVARASSRGCRRRADAAAPAQGTKSPRWRTSPRRGCAPPPPAPRPARSHRLPEAPRRGRAHGRASHLRAQDVFGCIDLSDNDLVRLEGFPALPKLRTLLVHNNRLMRLGADFGCACSPRRRERVPPRRRAESRSTDAAPPPRPAVAFLPNLETLILTNNRLTNLVVRDTSAHNASFPASGAGDLGSRRRPPRASAGPRPA